METADVVLMSDNLRNIPFAISIGRHARTVIWQNLSIALSVIVVLVISALGFSLPSPLGVVGHEGTSVLVCLNGLRLLAFRADGSSNNRDICADLPIVAVASAGASLTLQSRLESPVSLRMNHCKIPPKS